MSSRGADYWHQLFNYYLAFGLDGELLIYNSIIPREADLICDLIKQYRPQHILEIGTSVGLSAGVMALAAPDAMLVGIDPDLCHTLQHRHHPVAPSLKSQTTFAVFHTMLEAFKLTHRMKLLKGFSSRRPSDKQLAELSSLGIDATAVPIIGSKIRAYGPYDFVFIDGDHYADAVYHDLVLVQANLVPSGLILLHDVAYSWGKEVHAGIKKFLFEYPEFKFAAKKNLGFLRRKDYELQI